MSILDQFQKLDDLIVKHTQPPVRTILRNQLALTREQVEAYQAASDKQDQTLAAQMQTIERLMKEKEALVAAKLRSQSPDLDPITMDILKFFFDRPDGLTSKEIAQRFRLSPSAADYHLDVLSKRELLQQLTVGMSPRFCINHNGRESVMNRVA
jgi:DNA-binding MarR family transcriptional regulator